MNPAASSGSSQCFGCWLCGHRSRLSRRCWCLGYGQQFRNNFFVSACPICRLLKLWKSCVDSGDSNYCDFTCPAKTWRWLQKDGSWSDTYFQHRQSSVWTCVSISSGRTCRTLAGMIVSRKPGPWILPKFDQITHVYGY